MLTDVILESRCLHMLTFADFRMKMVNGVNNGSNNIGFARQYFLIIIFFRLDSENFVLKIVRHRIFETSELNQIPWCLLRHAMLLGHIEYRGCYVNAFLSSLVPYQKKKKGFFKGRDSLVTLVREQRHFHVHMLRNTQRMR